MASKTTLPAWPTIALAVVIVAAPTIGMCLAVNGLGGTSYSARYDEAGFQSLKVGMSPEEVGRVMGDPLDKVLWLDGTLLWVYSQGRFDTSNYTRRWVLFRDDRVHSVVADEWID